MWYKKEDKKPFPGHLVLICFEDEDGELNTTLGFYAAENSITMEFEDISRFQEIGEEVVSGEKGYEFYFPEGWYTGGPLLLSNPLSTEKVVAWTWFPKYEV